MQRKLSFAVLIDYDNLAIGVRTALDRRFEYKYVSQWLEERGSVLEQIAYANWNTHNDEAEVSRSLERQGVKVKNLAGRAHGIKNGADIALAVDAMEILFNRTGVDAFCILSGDSDFRPLVKKLKDYDKLVFIVAGTGFASEDLRRECHEFVHYEKLCGHRPRTGAEVPTSRGYRADEYPPARAVSAIRSAIRDLLERGEVADVPRIRTAVLRRDPRFDERRYRCDSFDTLVDQLVRLGHFRRISLGGGNYCIAERKTAERPRAQDFPPASDQRPERAGLVINEAVRALVGEGRIAELGVVYNKILSTDPDFSNYGCKARDFQRFVAGLSTQGRLGLANRNGEWVIEPSASEAGPATDLGAEARSLLQELTKAHAELLVRGVPGKQMELLVATHATYRPERLGVTGAGHLLEIAVRYGLLDRRSSGDVVRYFAVDAAPVVAEGETQPVEGDSGSDLERSPEAAVRIVCEVLGRDRELFESGLTRQDVRNVVSAARPDFDVKDYGLRSFRDLLDRVADGGFLHVQDDGHGLRYYGTKRLRTFRSPAQSDGRASLLVRLLAWLGFRGKRSQPNASRT